MLARGEVVVLRLVLLAIAGLMVLASRFSKRIRRQLTRDILFEISSDDGACQYLAIHARTRTISAPRRPAQRPDCVLRFATARDGITTLISTRTAGKIVRGMNTGGTQIEGNPVLVLWLHGLTRVVAPIGRTRVPYKPIPVPVREPETVAPFARYITREPAVSELDREWIAAWRARETLLQLRGPEGDRLPRG
jgi:hypothetical protein